MLAGAVYSPELETVPTDGVNDHVTALLLLPLTVAENCFVWDALSAAVAGETTTVIVGLKVTVAVEDLDGSATLVAVTVTV